MNPISAVTIFFPFFRGFNSFLFVVFRSMRILAPSLDSMCTGIFWCCSHCLYSPTLIIDNRWCPESKKVGRVPDRRMGKERYTPARSNCSCQQNRSLLLILNVYVVVLLRLTSANLSIINETIDVISLPVVLDESASHNPILFYQTLTWKIYTVKRFVRTTVAASQH